MQVFRRLRPRYYFEQLLKQVAIFQTTWVNAAQCAGAFRPPYRAVIEKARNAAFQEIGPRSGIPLLPRPYEVTRQFETCEMSGTAWSPGYCVRTIRYGSCPRPHVNHGTSGLAGSHSCLVQNLLPNISEYSKSIRQGSVTTFCDVVSWGQEPGSDRKKNNCPRSISASGIVSPQSIPGPRAGKYLGSPSRRFGNRIVARIPMAGPAPQFRSRPQN